MGEKITTNKDLSVVPDTQEEEAMPKLGGDNSRSYKDIAKKRAEGVIEDQISMDRALQECLEKRAELSIAVLETAEQVIRPLAHRLWEIMGRPWGHSSDVWYRAENWFLMGVGRKVIEEFAFALSQIVGQHVAASEDYWRAAEKLVFNLTAAMAKTPWGSRDREVQTRKLIAAFPLAAYEHDIQNLATEMWSRAEAWNRTREHYFGRAIDVWTSAEKHLLALITGLIRTAASADAAATEVVKELQSFSPEKHLDRIRNLAYEIWKAAGEPYGEALTYWLQAEKQILQQIAGAETEGG